MDSLSRFLGSQEFTDKVKYIEASCQSRRICFRRSGVLSL